MLPDEESIYPPPVLRKDIMKLQLFMGCFARKRVRHDSTNNLNKKYKLFVKVLDDSLRQWYSKQAVVRNCF